MAAFLVATAAGCARRGDGGSRAGVTRAPRVAVGCPATGAGALGDGTTHGESVRGSARWTAAGSPHRAPFGVHVERDAELVIEPCATVLVGEGGAVTVHRGATLRAEGASDRPVRFARLVAAGAWRGLAWEPTASGRSILAHVVVAGAGAAQDRGEVPASLRIAAASGPRLDTVAVEDGEGWGAALLGEGRFGAPSGGLTVRGDRGAGPLLVEDVGAVGDLPSLTVEGAAPRDVSLACRSRTLRRSAIWSSLPDGVRYRVRRAMHLVVEGAAAPVLTLAPGVRIAFEDGAELDVGFGAPGGLVAAGTALHPVVFEGADDARWIGVHLGPALDGARSHLDHLRIEHAGAESDTVLPGCDVPGGHAGQAMLTLHGVVPPELLRGVAFVDGPPAGYAVVVGGDLGAPPRPFGPAADFTRSGVQSALRPPPIRGACPEGAAVPR